ncbi:MAG: GNAT family N-acetyltransferase [Chlamydiales bacterium]|nr:GNAT family N-acetyltransferase [Chlamydiales bacterium]
MELPEQITFRPTRLEDAPYLTKWLMDPKILCWFPMIDGREVEDAVRIWIGYSRIEAGLTVLWNGEPCGMANLYIQPYKKLVHTCLFSVIVEEGMRGRGIGSFLLQELVRYAKEKFRIEVLHLEVYEGNTARRLYERLGFKPFGLQAHFIKENGKYLAKTFMQKVLT